MTKHKIALCIIASVVLTFIFWYGSDAPGLNTLTTDMQEDISAVKKKNPKTIKEDASYVENESKTQKDLAEKITEKTQNSSGTKEKIETCSQKQETSIIEVTEKEPYKTVPQGKPIPIEPESTVITDKKLTCTLSVRCDSILQNMGNLDIEKVDIVPRDGVIFAKKSVTFYEGENVFNLLLREMKRNKIHMEFVNTPIYNSAYIEGIANLYEFDCGELSGWMYKVNGWFPNYGCSRYLLKEGDNVEWVYTCDLGKDVGGHYSAQNKN